MATDLAPITPSVLKWARLSIGVSLDEAAQRAGVTAQRIEGWESGKDEPTVAKLRQLAKLYQRPLAIFFLPEPPLDFDPLRDFRRLADEPDHSWSRALHKVYRRALMQQEVTSELLEDDDLPTSGIPALAVTADPEAAAAIARDALGITLATQFSWRQPESALKGWLEAVESLGALVLRTSEVNLGEMRGFSLGGDNVPIVVINALDSPRGQIFTLAHEFAHLTLREGGLCNLLEPDSGAAKQIETWCNAFAGALLMPQESLLSNELVGPPGQRDWNEDTLVQLSQTYGVSREAVLRRLVTLGRANWNFYLDRRQAYIVAYEQQREDERARRRSKPGGPPPYRMAVRDRGKPYVRLVLDAYHREAISPSSLSTLLGLKLKHIPALEQEAATGS